MPVRPRRGGSGSGHGDRPCEIARLASHHRAAGLADSPLPGSPMVHVRSTKHGFAASLAHRACTGRGTSGGGPAQAQVQAAHGASLQGEDGTGRGFPTTSGTLSKYRAQNASRSAAPAPVGSFQPKAHPALPLLAGGPSCTHAPQFALTSILMLPLAFDSAHARTPCNA